MSDAIGVYICIGLLVGFVTALVLDKPFALVAACPLWPLVVLLVTYRSALLLWRALKAVGHDR